MSNELETLTKTLIEAQVVKALRESKDYIDELVKAALSEKVNANGMREQYGSGNNFTWLQYVAKSSIQRSVEGIVARHVSEMEPQITEAVKKALSVDDVVKAFTARIIETASVNQYRIDVTFKEDKR